MNANMQVTNAKDYLGRIVDITIDRPLHSNHPKHRWSYQLNYGFVPNTLSPDGEELDAYVIGINEPIEKFSGVCIAVIHRVNDSDDKLVVVTNDKADITDEEIRIATNFQEQFFQSILIRTTKL